MKATTVFAVVIAATMSATLPAQQVDAHGDANVYANSGGAQGAGFGDDAASRSWEMIAVNGELQGNVDSKTAKVGDRVVLKTTAKAQTSDGSIIPKGSRLVGRVTEVQAHNSDRAVAQLGIAFDHAELKNGQSVAIHSLIRTVHPAPAVAAIDTMGSDDSIGAPMSPSMSGGRMGAGSQPVGGGAQPIAGGRGSGPLGAGGGPLGPNGTATNEAGTLGGTIDRTGNSVGQTAGGLSEPVSRREDSAVQLAGHGDSGLDRGAHSAAAARATPHPTGIPGVMLAGSGSASGLFVASGRNDIQFTSGMQMQLGIVSDR
jgi:hypothetical protein